MHTRPDRLRLTFLFTLLGSLAGCTMGRPPCPPEGGEVRVSTTLPGDQREPAAAMSARASVVVWIDAGPSDTGRGIFGQRFDAAGRPVGGEFRVDAAPDAPGVLVQVPDVAMNAAGASVVVWEVRESVAESAAVRVFARRYDAAGRALGETIEVSTTPTHRTAEPAVAIDASGAFVVVWQCENPETATLDVFIRRYAAPGDSLGVPVRVDGRPGRGQSVPDVAMGPGGALVVTWSEYGTNGEADVLARRYVADSTAGDAFRINAPVRGRAEAASVVAMDASGAFVIAWQTSEPVGSNDGIDIMAQRFSAAGEPAGGPVVVSAPSTASQVLPAVAVGPGGQTVVVWHRDRAEVRPNGHHVTDVLVQRFGPGGIDAEPVRANGPSVGYAYTPAVATDAAGNVLVAWDALRLGSEHPGEFQDVYTRRYRRP